MLGGCVVLLFQHSLSYSPIVVRTCACRICRPEGELKRLFYGKTPWEKFISVIGMREQVMFANQRPKCGP